MNTQEKVQLTNLKYSVDTHLHTTAEAFIMGRQARGQQREQSIFIPRK
jgi:hypothetical protein